MSLSVQSGTSVDNHTVPSSRFTRAPANSEAPSSPPPQNHEPSVVFRQTPLAQRNSNPNGTIEHLARQMNMAVVNGNDSSTTNGQATIIVKEPKIVPPLELTGAVTRAKDGLFFHIVYSWINTSLFPPVILRFTGSCNR